MNMTFYIRIIVTVQCSFKIGSLKVVLYIALASLARNGTKLTVDITNELKFCFWGAKSRKSISFGLLYSFWLSCLQKDHLCTMLDFGFSHFLPRIATLSIWPVPSTSFGPQMFIWLICMHEGVGEGVMINVNMKMKVVGGSGGGQGDGWEGGRGGRDILICRTQRSSNSQRSG